MATLVLTVIGDDRSGLVSALSAPFKAHGAQWERSRMARLAGKFAGILEVVVPDDRVPALEQALAALADEGLHVTVERTAEPEDAPVTRLSLDLLGADRPGIVADVSALLARERVGIEELTTQVRDAPMAGGRLFEAHAVLAAPASVSTTALRTALEALADELMVDLALQDEREMQGSPQG